MIASPSPSRNRPAWARTMASRSCSRSLRSRVSTLPRRSTIRRSGRRFRSCAFRRRLLVPTTAPSANPRTAACLWETKASPVGPRGGTAASSRPGTGIVGRSLRLWTATSTRLARRASWIDLVNTPNPPMAAIGRSWITVAVGLDDDEFDRPRVDDRAEPVGDVVGLPEGEVAAAGAETEGGHHMVRIPKASRAA